MATKSARRALGVREPQQSDEARFERMERVSEFFGQITAATREFLRAVAACDRHGDWSGAGRR